MKIYFLLFRLILIAFVDSCTGDPIVNLFRKQINCKPKPFLIDSRNHFKLFFDGEGSVDKVDVVNDKVISDGSKFKFLSPSDDYFSGCLLKRSKGSHFYFIIYQNRIIRLNKNNLFSNFSYLNVDLDLKDNPRLVVRRLYNENEPNKTVYELVVSSLSPINKGLTLGKIKHNGTVVAEINLSSNNLTIEYNLLQGLLNQDFDLFSSTDSEHIFIENDLLVLSDKNNHSFHQISRSSFCADSNELALFLKIIIFFLSILFLISILLDYTRPFNHDLDFITGNLKSQDDNEQIKYCLDTKSLLEKNRSEESIKTINSAGMR